MAGNRVRRNRRHWNPIQESGKRKKVTGIDGRPNHFGQQSSFEQQHPLSFLHRLPLHRLCRINPPHLGPLPCRLLRLRWPIPSPVASNLELWHAITKDMFLIPIKRHDVYTPTERGTSRSNVYVYTRKKGRNSGHQFRVYMFQIDL